MHRFLLLSRDPEDPLLLRVLIGAELIDHVFLFVEVAHPVDLELVLLVPPDNFVPEVDVDQQVGQLNLRKQVIEESPLELRICQTHILVNLENHPNLRCDLRPKSIRVENSVLLFHH